MMSHATATLLLLVLPTAAFATPQGTDARSSAMGGTGVASAKYWNAPFTNPALLTQFDEGDDWAIVLPTIGGLASDPDELVDHIDAFTDQFELVNDVFDGGGVPTQGQLDDLADMLLELGDRQFIIEAHVGTAVSIPSKTLGMSFLVRARIEARVFTAIDADDADSIRTAITDPSLPDLESVAVAAGALVQEYGVAFARDFEISGRTFSFGITPKVQTVETFNYAVSADSFDDDDDFDADQYTEQDSGFNVDLGMTMSPAEDWTVGLLITDLLASDYDSVTTLGRQFTYSLEPVATVGGAWHRGGLTLAGDLDLTKREPFDFAAGSQYLSLGAEYGWKWAQLRGGYRADLEGEAQDVLTAGLGFSPWGMFHIDLAGMVGDETYGAMLETSLSF